MEVVVFDEQQQAPAFSRALEEVNREFVKFIFSSHKHFVYLQRHFGGKTASGDRFSVERKRLVCESSRVFREHLLNLKDELIYLYDDAEQQLQGGEQGGDEECLDYLVEVVGVADSTQSLWHFLEFMVLLPSHATWLQAAEWLRDILTFSHPVNVEEAMTHFSSTDSPEFLTHGSDGSEHLVGKAGEETSNYFWHTIYSLLTVGRISDAWSILQMHSEVAEAINSSHNSISTQLQHIFTSHPTVLISLRDTDPELFTETSFLRQQIDAWQNWASTVRQLISENSALIVGNPPLLHILRFFIGMEDDLPVHTGDDNLSSNWQMIALHRLMFSPFDNSHIRLSRQDVSKVIMDAISLGSQQEGSNPTDVLFADVVTSLLKQELGDFLTFCATPPSWEKAKPNEEYMALLQDVASGMTLANTMHVAGLLRMSGDLSTAPGSVQSTFVMESVVAGCTQLSDMQFPHEIFSVYLEALCSAEICDNTLRTLLCPEVATSKDLTLGSLHPPPSDMESIELSNALLMRGDALLNEAQSVLVTRGLHWLEQGEVAKAFYFFTQAQCHGRVTALLDMCLRRCIIAFCKCAGDGDDVNDQMHASLWSLDGLAIDYARVSDIHSSTSRIYTFSSGPEEILENDNTDRLNSLEEELSVASHLLDIFCCHPLYPHILKNIDEIENGWEDEVVTGYILLKYSRMLHSILQYKQIFVSLSSMMESSENDESATSRRAELISEGSQLLQSAAVEVKLLLQNRNSNKEGSSCASSLRILLPQRYWLHVVDVSVWINKQNSLLRKCGSAVDSAENLSDDTAVEHSLFCNQDVDSLLRLLLLLKLTYVPNPLNGQGLRLDGGNSSRQFDRGNLILGEGQCRPKALDEFDAYEMDLNTELLDMKVSSLCSDNKSQFSSSSPMGFYVSSSVDSNQFGLTPSLFANTSSITIDSNVTVNRYLTVPVSLQNWRREQLN